MVDVSRSMRQIQAVLAVRLGDKEGDLISSQVNYLSQYGEMSCHILNGNCRQCGRLVSDETTVYSGICSRTAVTITRSDGLRKEHPP